MAENYNLGSKFGFNVAGHSAQRTQQAKQAEVRSESLNLFDPVNNFFSKYEKVLNGDVEHDINMYSRQAMIVSMNLKASDGNRRKFDMNI